MQNTTRITFTISLETFIEILIKFARDVFILRQIYKIKIYKTFQILYVDIIKIEKLLV